MLALEAWCAYGQGRALRNSETATAWLCVSPFWGKAAAKSIFEMVCICLGRQPLYSPFDCSFPYMCTGWQGGWVNYTLREQGEGGGGLDCDNAVVTTPPIGPRLSALRLASDRPSDCQLHTHR